MDPALQSKKALQALLVIITGNLSGIFDVILTLLCQLINGHRYNEYRTLYNPLPKFGNVH
jgi:hypothetical protein